jgi:dTDP-4-dehydrorhamnose 3,5-epimerase
VDEVTIPGVLVTPLRKIFNSKGNIFHAMKSGDQGFNGFGEAYFSFVHSGQVKGWKKHLLMTLNLVVPLGEVRFVIYDDRLKGSSGGAFEEILLSENNYSRLTIPPGVWVAFQGVGPTSNLLLNLANLEHDPGESESVDLKCFPYSWQI